jgi:hypothetical protein
VEHSRVLAKKPELRGAASAEQCNSGPPISHRLLQLQNLVGNRAVQRLIASALQTSPGRAATSVQRSFLDDVGDFVSDAGSAIASGVSSVVDAGENAVSEVASGVSDVAGDVWSGVKNVAGDVASGVSDVAGDVWSGAKTVAGDVWSGAKTVAGDVAEVGGDIYGAMKTGAGYVQKGVGYVDKGVDWLEDEAKSGTHWLADKAQGIPVLEQLANAGETVADTAIDFQGGLWKGLAGVAGGMVSAEVDPIDTVKGLYSMAEHIPGIGLPEKILGGAYDLATTDKTWGQVADETFNPMSDLKYWGNVGKSVLSPVMQSIASGKPGEAVGQADAMIASMVTGEGEAGAAGELAEGSEIGEGAQMAGVPGSPGLGEPPGLVEPPTLAEPPSLGEPPTVSEPPSAGPPSAGGPPSGGVPPGAGGPPSGPEGIEIPPGASKPYEAPSTFDIDPISPGESKLNYGTAAHQELPQGMSETNPGAQGTFNVAPGLTGPDFVPQSGYNANFGEMKPITGDQGAMLRQARNWGFDPQTGRYYFYDRDLGKVFEGIIQTEKFPSGKFR